MVSVLLFAAFFIKAFLVVFLLLLARGLVWLFNLFVLAPPFDPLRNLPGPEATALGTHLGNVMEYVHMWEVWRWLLTVFYSPQISPDTHKEWVETYGNTFRFHGFGRVCKSVFHLFQCLTSFQSSNY